jgi:tRNA-dihydrouridine synthase 1
MAAHAQQPPVNLDPSFAGARAYEFYRKIGSPKFVVAPMVNQSELPFRMLTRNYKADLCYTPMMQAKKFGEEPQYRKGNWDPAPEDRPLFAQFCANDPQQLLAAAKHIESQCDAVDINLGCPQGIARRGHYGAFLLNEPDLICSMVSLLYQNLAIPVTCKIRKLDNDEDTLRLCHRLQASGCTILTVHGRTRDAKKNRTSVADWDLIKRVKQELTIPVFANGSIERFSDVQRCLEYTGCDGVMVSEAILENPALFSSDDEPDTLRLADEYIECFKKYPSPIGRAALKPHLFKMLYRQLSHFTDVRSLLGSKGIDPATIQSIPGMIRTKQIEQMADSTTSLYAGIPSWYQRHLLPASKPGGKSPAAPSTGDAEGEESKIESSAVEEEVKEDSVANCVSAAAAASSSPVSPSSRLLDPSQPLKSAGQLALEYVLSRRTAGLASSSSSSSSSSPSLSPLGAAAAAAVAAISVSVEEAKQSAASDLSPPQEPDAKRARLMTP